MIKIKRLLEIKMKKNLLLILVFFVFGLISCSNDDSSSSDNSSSGSVISSKLDGDSVKYVSIPDANSLFFYDESYGRAISTGSQKIRGRAALKTVTAQDDESSSEVSVRKEEIAYIKYFDGNKREVEALNSDSTYIYYDGTGYPFTLCDICKINEKYTMFSYGVREHVCFSLLVRNSDGKVFALGFDNPLDVMMGLGDTANYQCVKADELGNIYYVSDVSSSQSRIIKAFVDENDNLVESILIEPKGSICALEVDSYGNILYELSQNTNGTYFFSKTKKLKNIGYTTAFWKGCDGYLYYAVGGNIKKVVFDGNYTEIDYNDFVSGSGVYRGIRTFCLKLKNRILFVGNYNGGAKPSIYEVYNENQACGKIELSNLEFNKINYAYATENYYFISGIDSNNNMVFVRVDPETNEYIKVLPDDSYEVYSFIASESNGITFNGMDMQGGKIVTAKVSIDGGEIYPLDEDSDEKIYGLTQIR